MAYINGIPATKTPKRHPVPADTRLGGGVNQLGPTDLEPHRDTTANVPDGCVDTTTQHPRTATVGDVSSTPSMARRRRDQGHVVTPAEAPHLA